MTPSGQVFADSIRAFGSHFGDPITVRLSNELVTLLSSQLYQSPLKAIEELVVNAFDADATECRLSVPGTSDSLPLILVYDDGIGMDEAGLADLWLVGRSNKRDEAYQRRLKRKQIGKFGIGKLATYAIANSITYISRTDDKILAVSANFTEFEGDSNGSLPIELPVTRIDQWDALRLAPTLREACSLAGVDTDLLFGRSSQSWTIVLLEELKPRKIHRGRLDWVLSTAMPLRMDFGIHLNRHQVISSKEAIQLISEFNVTDLPRKRLESVSVKTDEDWHVDGDRLISNSFPDGVFGTVLVSSQSLHKGKSSDLGRSHGFFVRARERLINEEDPLFGLFPLSYRTFNRFRADVTADDLDSVVTAPREGIAESSLRDKFIPLLAELFYEARDRYQEHLRSQDEAAKRKRESERTYVPTRLIEHPIADVLSSAKLGPIQGAEADDSWFYLQFDDDFDSTQLARNLYSDPRAIKYRYRYTQSGASGRLVKFDPKESTFYVNSDHDLVSAYYDDPRAQCLLEDLITAEAVLEVYLREHGVSPHVVGQILERRDSLLRGLANEHVFSVDLISRSLVSSVDDEHDLEVALVSASRALGFVATHISGAGEPDGIGRFRDYPDGEQTITLEAKSSGSTPTLAHLDFAGLKQHVCAHGANGCLLVAPRYPGAGSGEDAAVAHRARADRISCWTVEQLAGLVAAVEIRQIDARDVLDIVLNHFSPDDVRIEVDKLLSEPSWEHQSLYVAVLDALKSLEGRLPDRVRLVSHVATEVSGKSEFGDVLERTIKDALRDLSAASQGTLLIKGDRLILNASLEEVERRVSSLTGSLGLPRRGSSFRHDS